LHLHPDAQAGLADFFVYLASFGIVTIVETHSEYFLLRLRRRLAEGAPPTTIGLPNEAGAKRSPLTKASVSVCVAQESRAKGHTLLPLEIGPSFQFSNMPKGFMDQSVEERTSLLNALSKR
jgi:predicted ATPase